MTIWTDTEEDKVQRRNGRRGKEGEKTALVGGGHLRTNAHIHTQLIFISHTQARARKSRAHQTNVTHTTRARCVSVYTNVCAKICLYTMDSHCSFVRACVRAYVRTCVRLFVSFYLLFSLSVSK